MDSEQRRRRNRVGRPYYRYYYPKGKYVTLRYIILCLSFVFLVFLVNHRFPFNPASFRPVISTHFLYPSASNSLIDPLNSKRQSSPSSSPVRVRDRIVFPDHVLLFTSGENLRPGGLDCVYRCYHNELNGSKPELGHVVMPVLSTDGYDEFRSIVRCSLPLAIFSGVDLRRRGDLGSDNLVPALAPGKQTALNSWDTLVYTAEIDEDTAVVFVKGLNLRPHRKSDPSQFRCRFGLRNLDDEGKGFVLTTPALAAAQEVVRCALPKSIQINPEKAQGIRISISRLVAKAKSRPARVTLPSVARLYGSDSDKLRKSRKHGLCACTMVWNQTSALREWIMYHAWLGVERWFIYDNNSDDGIEDEVQELDRRGYNVTRRTWPWIKTQEAGFSHCALRAKDECNWVGFFDVDEFFYLPKAFRNQPGFGVTEQNALGKLVANFSSSETVGEIRTACHSFGPSGLRSPPSKGVTVGYTCRLRRPERHKSIVRPELLDATLLNVVHHFRLREGYRYLNVPESKALVNHYKYQVWESFRTKFHRRVATYVVDWQEDQNKGSNDRVPGLGTEAIEPDDWRLRFCEVRDTGLRDFVMANFADPATGSLPWEEERSLAQL